MTITRNMMIRVLLLGASSASLSLALAAPANAQLTTSTIRGTVSSGGTVSPGAVVTAVNVDTNATTRATAGPDGSYSLTGLRPGTYDIGVGGAEGAASRSERIIIGVGESATLDIDTSSPAPAAEAVAGTDAGTIVVTGRRLVEVKTSEVATNVSREQIENLPQNNRNFLNFATLAPGIKVNQTDTRQTFAGGGVGADRDGESTGGPQVNVFIDGVSLKSNLQQGGIVGQDISRGNPFSQLAVQEFRVLTSNFKAEYEDAGTAIITAITKSGTNKFHGEVFGTYQNNDMISRDFLQKRNDSEVNLKRYQYGAALGGPIIKDNLFFFANYEANIQDRAATVTPGAIPAGETLPFDPQSFAGTFKSPFREHLGFAKLNWEINANQSLEVSGSIRKETDVRDFGGQAAVSKAVSVKNDVYTGKIRHQLVGDGYLNEFTVDYLKTKLAFGADLSQGFGLNYAGVIQIGGKDSFQRPEQEGLTFRNNFTLKNVQWNGDHLIKAGAKVSFQNFSVGGSGDNFNPQFQFESRPFDTPPLSFDIPQLVRFGAGDPEFKADTTQYGLFVQDDWAVNDHLLLNLGIRWDVDSNARNRDFKTPDRAVEALLALGEDPRIQGSFFDVDDYISTGKNRKVDYDNIAPRIGFSYDLNADQRTVFFGGYGRYYDRALYRNAAEEALKAQYINSEVFFSADGLPLPGGRRTVMWDPIYLTPEGFEALRTSLAASNFPSGELRAIPNDFETPYTDQFSLGIRQRFGALRTSLTFNYTIGKDQVAYLPLNRDPEPNAGGNFNGIGMINGYGNLIGASNHRETRYKGVFLQVDKPYTRDSGYGFGLAYTLAYSKGFGYEFDFDTTNPEYLEFQPNAGNERHRVVINGIADLPWGLKGSGILTLASGVPAEIYDFETEGFSGGSGLRRGYLGAKESFSQLDLRLLKEFRIMGGAFQVWAEVFNVFNTKNDAYGGFICCGSSYFDNENNKTNTLVGPPRSLQLGTAFRF